MSIKAKNFSDTFYKISVKKQVYYDPEQSWGVFLCGFFDSSSEIIVRGNFPPVSLGENYKVFGSWIMDKRFGKQFDVKRAIPIQPDTVEGLTKYLSSDLFKGIGVKTAQKVVSHFGVATLQILNEKSEKLKLVRGLGREKIKTISKAWQETNKNRNHILFLYDHGIVGATAQKVLRAYDENLIEEIHKNPYDLMDKIHGISFLRADSIALSVGLAKDSHVRVKSAIRYLLSEGGKNGHCYLLKEQIFSKVIPLLEIEESQLSALFEKSLCELKNDSIIIIDQFELKEELVYLKNVYFAEKKLASKVKELNEQTQLGSETETTSHRVEAWLRKYKEQTQVNLSEEQEEAIKKSVGHRFFILTGGPGVGKSMVSHIILKLLFAMKRTVALAAPTGRAAKRLSELTGYEAKTVHRLLEWSPREKSFLRSASNPLDFNVIIIDESSMLDVFLAHYLLRAVKSEAQVILIGDSDQLPAIGPGHVLCHLIDSQKIPTVRLKKIFRQDKESFIVSYAHKINQGKIPDFKTSHVSDCHFIEASQNLQVISKIKTLLIEELTKLGFNSIYDVQILTPMNKGVLGCYNLNKEIQVVLLGARSSHQSIGNQNYDFFCGDKVIQLMNNYDLNVFNGDIGYVSKIDREEQSLCVDFGSDHVVYDKEQINHLALAYAITIHKSQGSEFPVVLIPMASDHYHMLNRSLVYTALTRARQLAVFIGSKKMFSHSVHKNETVDRQSSLKGRL